MKEGRGKLNFIILLYFKVQTMFWSFLCFVLGFEEFKRHLLAGFESVMEEETPIEALPEVSLCLTVNKRTCILLAHISV